MIFLACIALVLALVPCLLFLQNLRFYRPPSAEGDVPRGLPGVSVLIPARNEEQNIGRAIQSVRASEGIEWELLVLDDQSTDNTAQIVRQASAQDARVRLVPGKELPAGWNGKQHACHLLAQQAHFPLLVFMDADVHLAPDALKQMAGFLHHRGVALASGVPRQITGTLLECLVVPLIHIVLLGFLPLNRMRASVDPAYGAGCGQLFITSAAAYRSAGGHSAIRQSRHDGVQLPRLFRRAGFRTDLFDATSVTTCRMYHTASEVWNGFIKNAHEGLAAPGMILPATMILLGGQVLPWVLLLLRPAGWGLFLILLAVAAGWGPRWLGARRFRQSWTGALLHPLGVLLLVLVQWVSLLRRIRGKATPWKGRVDAPWLPKSMNSPT